MNDVGMLLLGNDRFPTLEECARRRIFQLLDADMPRWNTSVIGENLRLTARVTRLERDIEKMSVSLRRQRSRIRESLHDTQYQSWKMIEIANAIRDRRLHYAESELRTLSSLDTCETALRRILDIIEVWSGPF